MNDITCDELIDAFVEELHRLDAFRKECLKDILAICKAMHELRKKLTEEMIQVLVENKWKEGEVTKHLAEGCASLLKAMNALENKNGIFRLDSSGISGDIGKHEMVISSNAGRQEQGMATQEGYS